MEKKRTSAVRIKWISIKNYKGIDFFEMDFPIPQMAGDPDIIVMGSRNGLGKTSLIECCVLLLTMLGLGNEKRTHLKDSEVDLPDMLIKAGSKSCEISGKILLDEKHEISIEGIINNSGIIKVKRFYSDNFPENLKRDLSHDLDIIRDMFGFSLNPVIGEKFMLFHSYRKVQEGKTELGRMVERDSERRMIIPRWARDTPISEFKLTLLRSLMSKADLFEGHQEQESDEIIDKLNGLLRSYVGGTITKLRPFLDGTVDFRIMPDGGKASYTFDGLSSGQKEIVSTLFLIWHHTRNNPSVVFIDEPELHLNPEWHGNFVRQLITLAPQNQYILATHSEDVMASVDDSRRILLLDSKEGEKA